jgi:hypothetical protein
MTDQQRNGAPGAARPDDDQFSHTVGRMLRESAEQLDAASVARLKRGREAALEEWRERRTWRPWLVPAASLGALAALAAGLWFNVGTAPKTPDPLAGAVDSASEMDLLLAGDSMEMFEDLDFYAWLDAEAGPEELSAELDSAT